MTTRFFTFIKAVYHSWDSAIGNFFNILGVFSPLLTQIFPDTGILRLTWFVAGVLLLKSLYSAWARLYGELEVYRNRPEPTLYTKWSNEYKVIELENHSDVTLEILELRIEWMQEDGPQNRTLIDFLPKNADILKGHASQERYLTQRSAIWATKIPNSSYDNKAVVTLKYKYLDTKIEKTVQYVSEDYNDKKESDFTFVII